MTLLPFLPNDIVRWRETLGVVVEVRGSRVVVETEDKVLHITTEATLRAMQGTAARGAA